jgi:glucose-6-phosphate isomerase
LQLYLDGPKDKLFTVLTLEQAGRGPTADADMARRIGAGDLAGRSIGDIVDANGKATASALAARGLPVRRLSLARLNEESLGALFMHFMLETILAADLLGVDPFGQPAVEEGKVLMRQYLAADGAAE